MKYDIKVSETMTGSPITISANKTLEDAGKTMIKKGVGSLIVLEDDKLIGIITEKDIVRSLADEGKDPKVTSISDAMTRSPITVEPGTDLYDVAKIMTEKKLRRLPVVNDQKELIGIITEKDMINIQPSVIDILVERVRIELPEGKVPTEAPQAGNCEECGNYSDTLTKKDNKLVCSNC